jgi:hypothetical protein
MFLYQHFSSLVNFGLIGKSWQGFQNCIFYCI